MTAKRQRLLRWQRHGNSWRTREDLVPHGEEFARVERREDVPAVLGIEGPRSLARFAGAHACAVRWRVTP
jgi:hypothetical protein